MRIRLLGIPAHVLLGGAARDAIPFRHAVGATTDGDVLPRRAGSWRPATRS